MKTPTSVKKRLLEDDKFVKNLIDTIPPKIYFNHDVNEHLAEEKHGYIDSKMKSYGVMAKKMKIRGKQKRARLNPTLHKTVTQIQEEMERNSSQDRNKSGISSANTSVANPLMLKERLAQKIKTFKTKRTGKKGDNPKSIGRQEKKEIKKKNRKKKRKMNKAAKSEVTGKTEKKTDAAKAPKSETAIFNKEAKLVYSKFEFGDGQIDRKDKQPSGKGNLKKALKKISIEKEKLQLLTDADPEKAEKMSRKIKWKAALSKSEGIKLKDNPELLKKSMKRRDHSKKKSQKKWADRAEQVKSEMDARQAKRTKNIRDRKLQRIDKKIKRARKKGRMINGN